MTFDMLKDFCDITIKSKFSNNVDLQKKYKKEIKIVERFYKNGRNFYNEMWEKKDKLDTRYVIPYLFDMTKELTDKKPVYIQVKSGASGGKAYATRYRNVA